ncbi:MAG: glycosyltransferase [Pseudomonadota bacterium]
MSDGPTIAFFPEASFGAALNCVGIAQQLRILGANPVFICHPGFTGLFTEYGFREFHLPDTERNSAETNADYWQNFITTHLPHFNLTPFEQLDTYVTPAWDAIVDTVENVEDGLKDLLAQIKPDVIVLDNVIMFPAIANAGCPWVRVVSCAETEIPDPKVPPYLSGLSARDTEACHRFQKSYLSNIRPQHQRYNDFRKAKGLHVLPAGTFLETSPWLNLLLSPEAVRYERADALSEKQFVFLDGCVRDQGHFKPPQFAIDVGPLIYMSFGSLGASDTDLIGRMIHVFADLPARFLVNVGGFLESYDAVPDNVILGSWFPQPSVVEQCALFIHHGGNNSFCEALYYGVPSLVMPYCWDGHDNAQRCNETGVGLSVDRATWTEASLKSTIIELLNNDAMNVHLADISAWMKKHRGTRHAAESVLKVANAKI